MAQCRQTAHEFIQNAFAPMVAVLCSHDAELISQKNNLSFVELIQPFCKLTSEVHFKDPMHVPHPCPQLKIHMQDMNVRPPQPTLAKKMLHDVVANTQPVVENSRNNVLIVGDYDLQISASTPWYEMFRDTYLQVAYPSDHEFTRHLLACIFVVSSSHPDPMEQFARLTQQQHQQQHQHPNKLPKWFCPNIFRYYVLLHDVADEAQTKAEATYQKMKSAYGNDPCHLLQINSKSLRQDGSNKSEGTLPDPWSQFLAKKTDLGDTNDVDNGQGVDVNAFPGKVTEGNPEEGGNAVETATEATEMTDEVDMQTSTNSLVIDHPLANEGNDMANDKALPTANHMDNDNRTPRDRENNAIDGRHENKSSQRGACLTLSDHDRLRIFIHEFASRGLIPWAEKTLRTLNEQVTSRKGIHRSFFSATKKWFGGNKPSAAGAMTEKALVVYTPEAPEMQMRRLGDLAFMFQLYEIAYQSYHTLKRDFNNDHAWLYYAGALEMACLAVFMQGINSQRQYPTHYMETAVSTYLNTCKNPSFATRCTILSTESLKNKGMYAEAAMQFIKMTSEDSDLRSALLLEQAAHCFINMVTPMVRKYAFHMILAGHRYSKAGQRKHAHRSYSQALQVYKGKDWTLAEDHINFTIGRQSFNLKQLDNATAAFKHILTVNSKQAPPQQSAFLKEYIFVFKQQLSQATEEMGLNSTTLPQLPLPVVDGNATKVHLNGMCQRLNEMNLEGDDLQKDCNQDHSDKWQKLEELIVMSNTGSLPATFKPYTQCFTNKTKNSHNPIGIVSEKITLEVCLINPLKIPLVLTDVLLLWKFLPIYYGEEAGETPDRVTNETPSNSKNKFADELIDTSVLEEVVLEGNETRMLQLSLTPHRTGELDIIGVAYNLGTSSINAPSTPALNNSSAVPVKATFASSVSVRGKQTLEVQGPRLNQTKAEKAGKMYGPDRRLDLVITSQMPRLEVNFSHMPSTLLCGQIHPLTVEFRNVGQYHLSNLKVATTDPDFLTFGHPDSTSHINDSSQVYETLKDSVDTFSPKVELKEINHVLPVPVPNNTLSPEAVVSLPIWVRGHTVAGKHEVHLLFVYESSQKNPKLKHRVVRHTMVVNVSNSIGVRAIAQRTGLSRQKVSEKDEPENQLNAVTVSVEIDNMNQLHDSVITEFTIQQVSCVSREWQLEYLSPKGLAELKVKSKETMLLSFTSVKCQDCQTASVDNKMATFSNIPFSKPQINSAATPCSDFYFRSTSCIRFEDVVVEPPNPALMAEPDLQKIPPELRFADVDQSLKVNLTLVVLWKAFVVDDAGVNQTIFGQHHITLDKLNSMVYCPPQIKTPIEQPPVKIIKNPDLGMPLAPSNETISQLLKYTLVYKKEVLHHFSKCRLCRVPIMVKLHNCSKVPVWVDVETSQPRCDSAQKPTAGAYHDDGTREKYSWIGHTSLQTPLEPECSRTLTLHACFFKAAVYNLGTLLVFAHPQNPVGGVSIERTLQKPSSSSFITITNQQ